MSKAAFVKAFSDFLKENVPYYEDIDGLVYVEKKVMSGFTSIIDLIHKRELMLQQILKQEL